LPSVFALLIMPDRIHLPRTGRGDSSQRSRRRRETTCLQSSMSAGRRAPSLTWIGSLPMPSRPGCGQPDGNAAVARLLSDNTGLVTADTPPMDGAASSQ
jgi:hypothetical protein